MSGGREKEARRQAIFREVNEWIEQLARGFDVDGYVGFMCECGSWRCAQHIEMTRAEYERVRTGSAFAVAVGHENPDTDAILDQNERFVAVKAVAGAFVRRRFSPGAAGRPAASGGYRG